MTAPAIEAGFSALREAGLAGTSRIDAGDLADEILDAEFERLGLTDADLDDAGRQWWGGTAVDLLMGAHREGLRDRARSAIQLCMLDVRTPVNPWDDEPVDHLPLRDVEFGEDWMNQFIEEAAAAADLPAEDILSVVAEFCPIREGETARTAALVYAEVELRTYHRPQLAREDDSPTSNPDPDEIDGWMERLHGVDGAFDARAALWRFKNGMVRSDGASSPPVDLWQRHEAPDLPKGLLSPVIERFAFGQAETMGADPAGLAMSALAVCAAAITDDIAVQVKQHDPSWREPARLWVGLVGMPSTKKTPIMGAAMRPLRRIDGQLAQQNDAALCKFNSLTKAEQAANPKPKQPRRVVEDATVESLQQVLADSPYGVMSSQDELSGWFGAHDKYTPGKGAAADRAFYLKSFNGGQYAVSRVARGSSLIPNLSISLLGGIQPEPLRKIVADSQDDGLIQRFLPVVLRAATVGHDVPLGNAVADYEAMVEMLTRLAPPRAGNLSAPLPLTFASGARAVRERLEVEHSTMIHALEMVSPKLAAHFGKLDGIFARLCVLWHCVEHPDGELPVEIGEDVAERVSRFMEEFLRPNAVAFYAGLLGMSAGHEDLMALAAFIVSDGLSEISAREVQRSTRALRHVTADDARRLCEKLESFGWLHPMTGNTKGGTTRWRVTPEVHTMFAERGRQETERRAAARAAIADALRA